MHLYFVKKTQLVKKIIKTKTNKQKSSVLWSTAGEVGFDYLQNLTDSPYTEWTI